jgi:hypothetical protein
MRKEVTNEITEHQPFSTRRHHDARKEPTMLNYLLLGQTVTRPNGFWRGGERRVERERTFSAVLRRRFEPTLRRCRRAGAR